MKIKLVIFAKKPLVSSTSKRIIGTKYQITLKVDEKHGNKIGQANPITK